MKGKPKPEADQTEELPAVNHSDRQAGAVDVTPEMIQAGTDLFEHLFPNASSAELVEAVYRAMVIAKRTLHRV